MCGIIGYCGNRPAVPFVIEGLRALEYRGYDSSGVAYVQGNSLEIIKAAGKLINLEEKLAAYPSSFATVAMGHTRWATHGQPSEQNAHPHQSANKALAIVHNGIIENYQEIKEELLEQGICFQSDTDTEVIANLIAFEFEKLCVETYGEELGRNFKRHAKTQDLNLLELAFRKALSRAEGGYAVVLTSHLIPQNILAARMSAPLILGVGVGEHFIASDTPAFLAHTRDVVFLENSEFVNVSPSSYAVKNLYTGEIVNKKIEHVQWDIQSASKDGYSHYMIKEIMEQPKVIHDCLIGRIAQNQIKLPELDAMPTPSHIRIIACGTSYNAGLWSQSYFEHLAGIPVSVEIASEFSYRNPILGKNELVLVISQSGETADTLNALRLAKNMGHKVLALCNVVGSHIAREADVTLYTQAGPEISVASTKAMLSQMVLLLLMSLYLGQRNQREASLDIRNSILQELQNMPEILEDNLGKLQSKALELAKKYAFAQSFFYLGRGSGYALALEGALKLKEISYIHAEGYAAGEMKHGPIALIDPEFPSFVLAFNNSLFYKVCSGIGEIQSRQGKVIALVQGESKTCCDDLWSIPDTILPEFLALPAMQLFSYEMAKYLGKDVDQPRNLAKSVTVE